MNEEQRLVQKRLRVLEHAQKTGNVRKTCRYFGLGRSSFYRGKSAFDREGEAGLVNKPRVARNHPNQLSREVVDRVLVLRRKYHLGRFLVVHQFDNTGCGRFIWHCHLIYRIIQCPTENL